MSASSRTLCPLCNRPPNSLQRDCSVCAQLSDDDDNKIGSSSMSSSIVQSLSQSLGNLKNSVDLGGHLSNLFSKKSESIEENESDINDYIDNDCEDYSACYSGSPSSPAYPPTTTPAQVNPLMKTQLLCLPPSTNSVSVQTIQYETPTYRPPLETRGYLYRLENPFYNEDKFHTNQKSEIQLQSSGSRLFMDRLDRKNMTPDKTSQPSSVKTTPIKGEINLTPSESFVKMDWSNLGYTLKASFVVLFLVLVATLLMEHVDSVRDELIEKQKAIIYQCETNYNINKCYTNPEVIEEHCQQWRKCMNTDPRAKVSTFQAITSGIAHTLNTFFEQLTPKSTFCVLFLVCAIVVMKTRIVPIEERGRGMQNAKS